MSAYLSEEARLELQEAYEQRLTSPDLAAELTEVISEELDLAVKAIECLEAPESSPVPGKSRKAAGGKRKFLEEDDSNVFQNLPPSASREIPALPSRGKDMGLVRKSVRRCSSRRSPSVRSLSPTASTCSSSSEDLDDTLREVNEELQRRAEFRQRMDNKMKALKKKIKNRDDLVSRLRGEKKSLRVQRENLRDQIRQLDEQELSIDKRERSAVESRKRYDAIAAKFSEINN